ncbi:MAG TPA: helix-turn-helix domain-containing protein [Pseudomonas sp.]|nr:helix-turn-helix domain-containing protein [Pseudomonas sp.]
MNKTEIPDDPNQRWEWIKYQLRTNGSSLAKVARVLKVTPPAVKNVKRQPYPRIERAIAKELGLAPIQLWPERWNADGTPCRLRPKRAEFMQPYRRKHTAAHSQGHRKTGGEA